jgi:phage protein D
MDPETKATKTHTYTPPNAPDVGQVLKVNRRVESLAQAEKVARGCLRRKNQQEITGNFTLMGDTILLAGLTANIKGFGVFDGKYIIDEARHTYTKSAGYSTAIKSRKVLPW